VQVGLSALMLLSIPFTLNTMLQPELGREEWEITSTILERKQPSAVLRFDVDREIAEYVDSLPNNTLVAMDSFLAFPVNAFSHQHERFVIISDRDFVELVNRPENRVTHFLVPTNVCPAGQACLADADQLNRTYPALWERGAPWATLEKQFGGINQWRLYRIDGPTGRGALS
jgi:hypothetical protein